MSRAPLMTFCLHVVCVVVLLFTACSSQRTLVVLLPEEDGTAGRVTVETGQRMTTLDAPLTTARVDSPGSIKQSITTLQAVAQQFARALAAQPPAPVSFTLYFKEASTEVMAQSQATLAALLDEVASRQAVEVQVTGHTDRMGAEADNDRLSRVRAEAVQQMLLRRGLKAQFIRTVGRGEREPLIPTPDEQPEPRNRRVEVIVR